MTNIINFEGDFAGSSIRVTEDGRYSVLDIIRFCTGSKNPSQTWNGDKANRATRQKGIVERFPDIAKMTEEFQFPGRGQRKTPVAKENVVLEILKFFGKAPGQLISTSDTFYPRTEAQIMQVLSEAFLDCEPCTQFYCAGYRIDLYLAAPRIAVECDEHGHKNYSRKDEQKRERIIKSALGCSFVRFDPYSPEFNVGTIIKQIRELV